MKINKEVAIELVDDAKEAYEKLNNIVGKQRLEGKENSDEIKLWNGIQRSLELIKNNPFYGENAKKNLIPKQYIERYNVKNLFIVDLPFFWRMIYTLESDKIEIIVFILDIYTHKEYDKKFGFKRR